MKIDKRSKMYDLSQLQTENRTPKSEAIQFYSAYPNIGNYLPVMGIKKILGSKRSTDLWNVHDDNIDWDFVNQKYSWAVIGGAGLLYGAFETFWNQFSKFCEIPYIVWGIGACFPDSEIDPCVTPSVAKPVLEGAELVNLRDTMTAQHYDLEAPHISPCPTVAYLEDRVANSPTGNNRLLYSSHIETVDKEERKRIYRLLERTNYNIEYTDNIEKRVEGLEDIITKYENSSIVVTTRLHGAIIAYALGKPYIALARDEKVRAFHRLYGNGKLLEKVEKLKKEIKSSIKIEKKPIEYESVYEFGRRVKKWKKTKI